MMASPQRPKRRPKDDDSDPFYNPDRPRASLKNPTRPMTPTQQQQSQTQPQQPMSPQLTGTQLTGSQSDRQLFYGTDYSRPQTTIGPLIPALATDSARSLSARSLSSSSRSAPTSPAGAKGVTAPRSGESIAGSTPPPSIDLAGTSGRQLQQQRSGSFSRKQPSRSGLQRASDELVAACESSTPTASPPGPVGSAPESAEWTEIRALRSMLGPDEDVSVAVEGLKRLCVIVDPPSAPLETDPLAATWLAVPKRQQCLLSILSKLMNSHCGQHSDGVLKLCRLYLALEPAGSTQLAIIAKTIYSQSKMKGNDAQFKMDGIFPGMLRVVAQPQRHNFNTLLYITGALKHLSDGDIVRSELVANHAATLFAQLISPETLALVRETLRKEPDGKDSTKMGQLLVQVTSVLRNLAVNSREAKKAFVETNVMVSLCQLLPSFSKHTELSLNISRILSKLTIWRECLDSLVVYDNAVPALLQLLFDNNTTPAIVERVCFVLGNVTADNAAHRLRFLKFNAVQQLVDLLVRYVDLDAKAATSDVDVSPAATPAASLSGSLTSPTAVLPIQQQLLQKDVSAADLEQVLVKLVRLLANLAISPELGTLISRMKGIAALLRLLTTKTPEHSEELVLNVVGAITNLSFYNEHGGEIAVKQLEIAIGLVPLLLVTNEEAVVESARAFGNFSRSDEVRQLMLTRRIDEVMSVLLEHPNREVVFSACGVIMNVITDCVRFRKSVCQQELVPKLLQILHNSASNTRDTDMMLVICKTLFNAFIEGGPSVMSPESIKMLKSTLQLPVLKTAPELAEVSNAFLGVLA